MPYFCRWCKTPLGDLVVPEFMGIGSLFGDEDANNTSDSMFCLKCTRAHVKSCQKAADCGHESIIYEHQVTKPRFAPECAAKNNCAQTDEDDCIFCTEGLASATCVSFKCGHLFHESCISTHIKNMITPKSGLIGIANSCCPLCKEGLKWSGNYSEFSRLMGDVNALRLHMKSLCVAQIQKDQGADALPSDPLEYGMKHYNFYQCSKCKSLYCGGKRECGDAEPEGENVFLCGGCRGCPKHGDEFMSYKCRYCCSEALYFCFGHTHYCDYCHSHNLRTAGTNHQYMSDAPAACEGAHKCPLKMDHAPHGEEFAIRCNACADEVKDIFGVDIALLYHGCYPLKRDYLSEALQLNLSIFFQLAEKEILKARKEEKEEEEGYWNLAMLLHFLSFSLPRLAVVAATAAFLNSPALAFSLI